ncbi:sensor histidine kinase [Natronolimnobius baerhuensis]|uniref:histidine kinase n=1 Tax=Natronolimnobius baerhuensis TaxID=253108 RepID=A0A202EA52_9EURY|nr:HAMP domain-containing sensor histidine kinase [Natronolimnobius baerhuensis]OVE85122.1 two-component sensor histidine kinase [Natronolimnobius baerhuensis]
MTTETTNTVQLLVADEANRNALEGLLEDQFTVSTVMDELIGDLYLVDDRAFSQYHDRLERLDSGADPSFTPIVLIRRTETTVDESLLTAPGDDRPLIDDVVDAPVQQQILIRRLSNLLAHRSQFNQLVAQNNRLDEFASVVSHDLRNPLNVAIGYLESIQDDYDDSRLAEIEHSHERMEALIDDLLTIARDGGAVDDIQAVDLAALAETCWRTVDSPEATLRTETTSHLAADPSRLKQLLENLMKNAVTHGGDTVTVTIGDLEDGFYVSDDGAGIPQSERDQIFDAGYSGTSDGTGLGLNIVSKVINGHDWEVTVTESNSGGARFEISTDYSSH